jgi:hypothetical protein
MIRGDRRAQVRNTPDRRKTVRTPGAFKTACDVAYEAMRKLERSKQ